jgi:DnaK suppressor protein
MPTARCREVTSSARELLLEERHRTHDLVGSLQAELADIFDSARLVATDDEHDPEGSTIAFERSRVDALLQRATDHLAEIDGALDRIGDGRYGRCERCGDVIPPERLAARPASTTCVRCASPGRRGGSGTPR